MMDGENNVESVRVGAQHAMDHYGFDGNPPQPKLVLVTPGGTIPPNQVPPQVGINTAASAAGAPQLHQTGQIADYQNHANLEDQDLSLTFYGENESDGAGVNSKESDDSGEDVQDDIGGTDKFIGTAVPPLGSESPPSDVPPLTKHEVFTGLPVQGIDDKETAAPAAPPLLTNDEPDTETLHEVYEVLRNYLNDPGTVHRFMTFLQFDFKSHAIANKNDDNKPVGTSAVQKLLHSQNPVLILKYFAHELLSLTARCTGEVISNTDSQGEGEGFESEMDAQGTSGQAFDVNAQGENTVEVEQKGSVQVVSDPVSVSASGDEWAGEMPFASTSKSMCIPDAKPSTSSSWGDGRNTDIPKTPNDSISIFEILKGVKPEVFKTMQSMLDRKKYEDKAIWRAGSRIVFKPVFGRPKLLLGCSLKGRRMKNKDSANAYDEIEIQICAKFLAWAWEDLERKDEPMEKFIEYNERHKVGDPDIKGIYDTFRGIMTGFKYSEKRKLMDAENGNRMKKKVKKEGSTGLKKAGSKGLKKEGSKGLKKVKRSPKSSD